LINGLRSFYAMEGIAVYPSFAGKLKTTLQIIGISCIMFFSSFHQLDLVIHGLGLVTLYAALFFSLYSAVHYTLAMFRPGSSKGRGIREQLIEPKKNPDSEGRRPN
jgi:phosphatidylglycerophosphate synthase